MKSKEIWKDIPNFEGKYQVSNLGNVRSMNYRNTGEIKLLSKVRGLKKANKVILEEIDDAEKIISGYTTYTENYKDFTEHISKTCNEIQIGPIIGTHIGPKCYGIAYIKK